MSMFFWRGVGEVLYVATIANTSAPTASEIAAGVVISAGLNGVSGFETTVNRVGVPVLASDTDIQVNGPAQFGDSNLVLVEDNGVGSDADDVLRRTAITTLAKDTTGYLVFCRTKKKAAMLAGIKVDVFAGYVGGNNKDWSIGADVTKRNVAWIQTASPKQDVAIA
jgi:hypothetical protein